MPKWLARLLVAPDPRAVTSGEVVAVCMATVVAVVALVSLATAHLRILTLGSVALGTGAVLLALVLLALASGQRPRVVLDLPGLLVMAGALAVAMWFYLPGFHYGSGDRDPGGYVMHAIAMARGHAYDFTDPVLAQGLPVQVSSPDARFPGVWIHDTATGQIVPQFYHLWPALLATSYNVGGLGAGSTGDGGWNAIALTTPLVGIVALLLAVALARRVASGPGLVGGLAGAVAPAATGLLLGTNMLQVWQAKYPTSEMLAQLLFTAALLCTVIAIQTRWRWPAGTAGLLVGIGYLNRADGLLIVLGVIGLGAVLWVLGRFDARCWWCFGGLVAVLPYALWQAYGPARSYTMANISVTRPLLLAVIGVVVVAAVVLRPLWARFAGAIDSRLADPTLQRRAAVVFSCAAFGLFLLGMIRPVFGPDYFLNHGEVQRSFDEVTLYRLAWFLTWPGWLLMLGGIGWVALRRRAAAWVVLVPLMLLLPLYAWHAHNSTFFMWWGRRFIPTVLVGIVLTAAFALSWLGSRPLVPGASRLVRVGGPLLGFALFAPMFLTGVQQSRPLQGHDEWGGAHALQGELAALSGSAQGVWMWDQAGVCCSQARQFLDAPMWLTWDQISVLLPSQPVLVPDYVKTYVDHFASQPVFLVYEVAQTPPDFPGVELTEVREFSGTMHVWGESSISRPAGSVDIDYDFRVYRATPAPT